VRSGASRLGLFGVLLLSFWAAAGAFGASDAGLRVGSGIAVEDDTGRNAPLWIDNGRSPIASAEQRAGGSGGSPPTRASVVQVLLPARAGVFRPAFGIAPLPGEGTCLTRGRRTRGPPSL
tara:strand:+ start:12296 stop:12655 length:360 start_codon:yes stop_codon:yes gene_type:complete